MFPLIPLFALAAMFGGGATLAWYVDLSPKEQEDADRIAGDYAVGIFNKTLDDLTQEQADRVAQLTQKHFES